MCATPSISKGLAGRGDSTHVNVVCPTEVEKFVGMLMCIYLMCRPSCTYRCRRVCLQVPALVCMHVYL